MFCLKLQPVDWRCEVRKNPIFGEILCTVLDGISISMTSHLHLASNNVIGFIIVVALTEIPKAESRGQSPFFSPKAAPSISILGNPLPSSFNLLLSSILQLHPRHSPHIAN